MRSIAVIGSGYVGLVTGTCLADLGNRVTCIDTDAEKIAGLKAGKLPFYEPSLLELVIRNQHAGRLAFVDSVAAGIADAEFIFIAVGTPMGENGEADLSYVRSAAHDIAESLDHSAIVINKSTVPVETGDLVSAIIREHRVHDIDVSVVSNPEFLREGSAVADFMQPDRIILGATDNASLAHMQALYDPLNATILATDVRTAEMIKYTANAFLAMKISFINEIANVCELVGADVQDVVAGAGSDRRIGAAFMHPGLGFGGSCFPKDVSALVRIAHNSGAPSEILPAVLSVNSRQVERIFQKLDRAIDSVKGKTVGLLGLAFKPNTDDVRESPAVALAARIIEAGGFVVAHDPVAIETARAVLPDGVRFVEDCYEATNDADAVVIATDWNEYKQLDFAILRKLMVGKVIVDARNMYEPDRVAGCGLEYVGVGRRAGRSSPANGDRSGLKAEPEIV